MTVFDPKRILCPIDFSNQSAAALRVAATMAKVFSAELTVLHAQRLEAPVYFTAAQTQALKAHLRRSGKAARQYLRDFTGPLLPEGVSADHLLVEEDAVSAILNTVRKWKPGLLVMGTHGRTGLTHIRLGSVMESVLRQSTVPLLTVGPNLKAASGVIRRILCPVDLSGGAQPAFEHAASIAARTGAEMLVIYVSPEGEAPIATPDLRQRLCDWIAPEIRNQCSVREVVRTGRAAEQILTAAHETGASLVVIEARPRNFLKSVLFGSTTESVVRGAPCPVLTIRGKFAV
jgi:nucleotide-binding universal stress UspA family protein